MNLKISIRCTRVSSNDNTIRGKMRKINRFDNDKKNLRHNNAKIKYTFFWDVT